MTLYLSAVPGAETVMKVYQMVTDRFAWGDPQALQSCTTLVQSGVTSDHLVGGWWHRSCYTEFSNKNKYERVKKRHQQAFSQSKLIQRILETRKWLPMNFKK